MMAENLGNYIEDAVRRLVNHELDFRGEKTDPFFP